MAHWTKYFQHRQPYVVRALACRMYVFQPYVVRALACRMYVFLPYVEGVQKAFLLFFKEKAYTRVRAREKKCTWSIFYIIPKKQRKNTSKGTS